MPAQNTKAVGISIATKERAREAFVEIMNNRENVNGGQISEGLAEAMQDHGHKGALTLLILELWSKAQYSMKEMVQPVKLAQFSEEYRNTDKATEAKLIAEVFDYIRKNTDFSEFASVRLGLVSVNRADAIKRMESGRKFAPLSRARKIVDEGRYWISAEGILEFLDSDHPYYIDNGNGAFSKVSEDEWQEASWSERVFISASARRHVSSKATGPLVLVIGDAETGRLKVEADPDNEAIVTSLPKTKAANAAAKTPELRFPEWRVRDAKAELEALGVDLGRAPALFEMFRDV